MAVVPRDKQIESVRRRLNDAVAKAGGNLSDPTVRALAAEFDAQLVRWLHTWVAPGRVAGQRSTAR